MKSVQFVSSYQDEVLVSDIGKSFKNGEVKDLSDSDAAIVLTNPNFKDVTKSPKPAPVAAEAKE